MKKFIGIVKIKTESMLGLHFEIKTKFSNSRKEIEKWLKLYSNHENIVLENNEIINSFFGVFEDCSPITKRDKERAKKLYEEFMKND